MSEYLVPAQGIGDVLAGQPDFVHLSDYRFDPSIVLLYGHLQRHIAFHQNLVLLGCYLLPEVVEGPLHLLLVLIVCLCNVLDVLLKLALFVGQAIHIYVDAIKKVLEFALNNGLALLQSLHIVILVLSMDHTLRANALHVTFEAVVEQLLIRMLLAVLPRRFVIGGGRQWCF